MFERLKWLRDAAGVNLSTVLDIGAHDGTWADTLRRLYPEARVISFEANPAMEDTLKAKTHDVFVPCALGAEDGQIINFYCDRSDPHSTGNSMFCEATPMFSNPLVIELRTTRLDSVACIQGLHNVDLIKIDVQGAELAVLDGASETLQKTTMVVLEIPFLAYNTNAPLFADVIAYMAARGFRAVDIADLHYCHGVCIQSDVLFVREGHALIGLLESAFRA